MWSSALELHLKYLPKAEQDQGHTLVELLVLAADEADELERGLCVSRDNSLIVGDFEWGSPEAQGDPAPLAQTK